MALDEKKNAKPHIRGFEAACFQAADKLRNNMDPAEYKPIVLGLIFLKHISESFQARQLELLVINPSLAEDRAEYIEANIFWLPVEARWSTLEANASSPGIGLLIDDAMRALEAGNNSLKGVLPKDYARPFLNKVMLGELIGLISNIAMNESGDRSENILGRVYEYFLAQFAAAEGKRGGEFHTPRSVLRLLVEMVEPMPDRTRGIEGRVYDPCCGSGGTFVQSGIFVRKRGRHISDMAFYGQESDYNSWRLAKMNLAIRGIDSTNLLWNRDGSFLKDEHEDLKADFIIADPPFNIADWGGEFLRKDVRWTFGAPSASNSNYGWLQHIYHHLAPNGTAGVVLANGSMTTSQSSEGEIRRAMVEADAIDCMVALPGQLFYSTQIPACLWFLARNKNPGGGLRDRKGEVLFIDARKMGVLVDRTRRELTKDELDRIARTYHAWRGEPGAGTYEDVPGFCKSATLDEVRAKDHVLAPSHFTGLPGEGYEMDPDPPRNNSKEIAKVLVDTGRGDGIVSLIQGDLGEIDADIYVGSSHANPEMELSGLSLDALESRFNLNLRRMPLEPLITPPYLIREIAEPGTYQGTMAAPLRFPTDESGMPVLRRGTMGTHYFPGTEPLILVTRAPSASRVKDAGHAYQAVLESLIGSILYLEIQKKIPEKLTTLALPIIGGSPQRGYSVAMVLDQLLTACESLLKASSRIKIVKLVIPDEDLALKYKAELEIRLGPSTKDIRNKQAYDAICHETCRILQEQILETENPQETSVFISLLDTLKANTFAFTTLGALGRKISEAIADKCCLHFKPESINIKKLHKTDLCIKIESLNGHIAPWIISHLHNLRFHGNVAVHFETDIKYKPSEISEHELLATLVSIQRCLIFMQELNLRSSAKQEARIPPIRGHQEKQ